MSKAKKTKRYIIDKTAVIFNRQGFIGTSMSDLTKATNLTKGSIYGNFSNKQEVAIAAFNFNYQNLIKKFISKLSAENSSIEKLYIFLGTYEEVFNDLMDSGGCPILNNAVDADDTNDELNALSQRAFKDWNANIKKIIKNGKAVNEINISIDEDYYTDLFITIIEGGLMLSKATGEKSYFDHGIKHLKFLIKNQF